MQGGEILIEFFRSEVSAGEPLLRAALEGSSESLAGEAPAAGFRLRVRATRVWPGDAASVWARCRAAAGLRACERSEVSSFMENSGVYCIADHPTPGVSLASYELNPVGGELYVKVQTTEGPDCGILYGLRPQPRNKNRLAGLADWEQTVRSRDH